MSIRLYTLKSKNPVIYIGGTKHKTIFETKTNQYEKFKFKKPNIIFNHSRTNNGMIEYIKKLLNCTIYDGAGINHRPNATILKSVDNTSYYQDDLDDHNAIEYTLTGKNGDQDVNHHLNSKLLIAKNIYVYRVNKDTKIKSYTWYGKYRITNQVTRRHPGENGVMRNIIVLILHKVPDA